MKYIVITPVKNEAEHIRYTLDSVTGQTCLPSRWIIVDDGSTDNTAEIVTEYTHRYPWISLVRKHNTEEARSGGVKVVRAFNTGCAEANLQEYDFIVKLDGDLELPADYFETVIHTFEQDEKTGICGGRILNKYGNEFILEKSNDYHVRGAFKSVRTACFMQIGGFPETWNWDGLDEMKAMFYGWKTHVFEKDVKHYRPTSQAYNPYKHAYKSGKEYYCMRTDFILTFIRFLLRIPRKPYFAGACCFLYGYIAAFFTREPFTIDRPLGKFINRFHYKRIFK